VKPKIHLYLYYKQNLVLKIAIGIVLGAIVGRFSARDRVCLILEVCFSLESDRLC
jgi:Na+/serine symporter